MRDGSKILVRQTRSVANRNDRVRDTLKALGLGRIGKEKNHTVNATVRGMLTKVGSIVEISEAK